MRAFILCGLCAASVCAAWAEERASRENAMQNKIIGMYVHQHWAYKHPYAARTWTLEDWHGYLEGLRRIGYNTVLIWPIMETMPNPLTPSDAANLDKIAQVADMAHGEFGMRVFLTLSPNAGAKDDEARKYTFDQRPFFYCDTRVDVQNPVELGKLMLWREELLRRAGKADGVFIIDSDPGGWAGATNVDFAYLMNAHRKMIDRIRPGIELYYWIHAGWESYCKYYETGDFKWGSQQEVEDAILLLSRQRPEPWGIASGRGPEVADALGMHDRVMTFSYGVIEGEPSFPMTNFGGNTANQAGQHGGARGTMGNAQTHCVQLPNTFAFARGAQGLPCEEADYVRFAEDLIPGQGQAIADAWKAPASGDAASMRAAASKLDALTPAQLQPGSLEGLLFGDPQRFVSDLVDQLALRADLEDFHAAAFAEPQDRARIKEAFTHFIDAADAWQTRHGYKNMWRWEKLEAALTKLDAPAVNEALQRREYKGAPGKTPFEQVQEGFLLVETYTPHLIEAMRKAANAF